MDKPEHEIRQTEDGSTTLFVPALNETYHSIHGAIQESEHVFIKNGYDLLSDKSEFSILEIGFGTGLNAFLTLLHAENDHKTVHYTSIEAYPVSENLVKQLNYTEHFKNEQLNAHFAKLHTLEWGKTLPISEHFFLHKIETTLEKYAPPKTAFDLIYFDAFSPATQVEMWQLPYFEKLYESLKPNGLLTTYCAKGQVKRDLKTCGFNIKNVPGPPGKREMTIGWKQL